MPVSCSSVFPIQNDYFVCSQSSSEYEFPPISTSTISRQREREDSSGSCDALVSVDSQIEAKEGVTCVQPGLVLPIAKAIDSKESADLIAYAPRISFNDSNSERDRAHQMIASECSDARSVEQFNMEGHHYCMHRSQMLGDENDSCNMDDATRGNEKAKDLGCGPHVPTLSRTVMDTQCGLDTGSASHGSQDDLIGVSGEPTDEVVDSLDVKGNIIRILNSCHFRTVTYTSWLWNHLIRWQVQFGYANTLWSVALAAAVMGLFVLGRSWHHLQVQNRSLRTRLRAKEKRIIQLMFQLAQMRDSLSKAHQVPVICMKPSLHT
ncbi:hypothetical protein KP509_12G047800 [Ceratopteris richardii]|nr:hypothetical protein KP509_12G047800 [Ceratopteris richardii]